MIMTRKKLPAASWKWNCPVITVARAKRNTISDDASLSRLSPSIMLTNPFGTFTLRMMVVAEMASGGETIPPNRKPSANVKPGMQAWATKAITQEVSITIGNAKLVITRRHFQNSFQDTCQAAS
jgi:hypothetical protein